MEDNRFVLLEKFYTPDDVLKNFTGEDARRFQLESGALRELLQHACNKGFYLEYEYSIGQEKYVRQETQRFINRLYITALEAINFLGLETPPKKYTKINSSFDEAIEDVNTALNVLGIEYHLKKITHSYYGFALAVRKEIKED